MTVQEKIPDMLRPEVDAALAWFNSRQESSFEVTGILDPEAAMEASGIRPIRLILCSGEICEQRSFGVRALSEGYEVAPLEPDPSSVGDGNKPAELDPPPGARRGWLDRALGQHAFVVLVFYRGFW